MAGPAAVPDDDNQSPPFENVNLFLADALLRDAVAREGAGADLDALTSLGAALGTAASFETGRLANANPPRLVRRREADRGIVEYPPAYHEMMARSMAAGLHCSPWEHLGEAGGSAPSGAQVGRLAGLYMTTQVEPGHVCPVTMTHASVPALMHQPDLARPFLPKILSRTYDPGRRPAADKAGITVGMGLTEIQGGTDVRANRTAAEPVGTDGAYRLTGSKWFLSAPMSDAFLMLAQAPRGLSCFMVPRVLPDGTLNPIRLTSLKDKLGNRSNASAEVEIEDAYGWLQGEEGRGLATILEMVTMTRLDCAVASAGQMRYALALAIHHCRHRTVFGRKLVDQPMMTQVLADMALDVEAAVALAFRLARSYDAATGDEDAAAWRRLMTPITKYWVCKIAPALANEAMECLGGNGYVEDGPMARLYREMPLNAIWEGSGNVMCLDVLRVIQRHPEAVRRVLDALAGMADGNARLTARLRDIGAAVSQVGADEAEGRRLTEALALTAAAALLHAHAPSFVAEPFARSRLDGGFRQTYGAGGPSPEAMQIVDRALPG